MYLNRITLDVYQKTSPGAQYDKEFGSLLRYIEDVIFHHLSKRTNLGGFGYFRTLLYESNLGENQVLPQGQVLKVNLKNEPIDFPSLLKLSDEKRLDLLLHYIQVSVQAAEESLGLSAEDFKEAIENARKAGMSLKTHYDEYWHNYYKIDKK